MGEEYCHVVILNIYCSLQTDLGVPLKAGGGLVSVQVAEILGQKATEIILNEKIMTWRKYSVATNSKS